MNSDKRSAAVEHLAGVWDARAQKDAQYYIKCDLDDQSQDSFLQSGRDDVAQFVEPLLDQLPSALCALDIGCGIGRLTRALARHFDEVVGVDISQEMIDRANALEPKIRGGVAFEKVAGDGELPFADASFDFVFSYIVFQHLPTLDLIETYLRECARVLKPGALAKVQVNTHRRPFLERLKIKIVPSDKMPLLHRKLRVRLDPHDHMGVVLSEAQCRVAAEKVGLEVRELAPLGEQYTWMTLRR